MPFEDDVGIKLVFFVFFSLASISLIRFNFKHQGKNKCDMALF